MWLMRYGKIGYFKPFDQIARSLEGARSQNCDRSISYGIWGNTSRPLFLNSKFLIFHSTLIYNTFVVQQNLAI